MIAIADQSDIPVWGLRGWLICLLLVVLVWLAMIALGKAAKRGDQVRYRPRQQECAGGPFHVFVADGLTGYECARRGCAARRDRFGGAA